MGTGIGDSGGLLGNTHRVSVVWAGQSIPGGGRRGAAGVPVCSHGAANEGRVPVGACGLCSPWPAWFSRAPGMKRGGGAQVMPTAALLCAAAVTEGRAGWD